MSRHLIDAQPTEEVTTHELSDSTFAVTSLRVEKGLESSLLQKFISYPQVGLAVNKLGSFQILLILQADNPTQLGEFIVEKLQIPGVLESRIGIVVEEIQMVNWLRVLAEE